CSTKSTPAAAGAPPTPGNRGRDRAILADREIPRRGGAKVTSGPGAVRTRRKVVLSALSAVAAALLSCGGRPMRGDTGIRPYGFDLWDVRCPSGLRVIVE